MSLYPVARKAKTTKNKELRKHLKAKSLTIYLKDSVFNKLVEECSESDYGEVVLEAQHVKNIIVPKDKLGKEKVKLKIRNEYGVGKARNTKMHGYPTFKFNENDAFYIKDGKVIFDADNSEDLEREYKYDVKLIEENHELFDELYYSDDPVRCEVLTNSIYYLFNGMEEEKKEEMSSGDYLDTMSEKDLLKKAKEYKLVKSSVNQFYSDEMEQSIKRKIRDIENRKEK